MTSDKVSVSGIELAFDQFGRPGDPTILLMMGNSAPGLVWPDEFCEALATLNFRVVRYDQRDTGLSTYVDFERSSYTLDHLVDDAIGLLDALGVHQAHLVGLSQGGNLALRAGLVHPSRVASITTMMSSPDLGPKNDAFAGRPPKSNALPGPAANYVQAVISLNSAPACTDTEVAERFVENFRLAAGPKSPFDQASWNAIGDAFAFRRLGQRAAMANHSNHGRAQAASPSLTSDDLALLSKPCLIIHGECDPIFPIEHAHWAKSHIDGAELLVVADMGHALDKAFIPEIVDRIGFFCHGSTAVRQLIKGRDSNYSAI
ncbi:alpha/beta fold hydrolase [Rhizobium sp. 18055]|uniref:alpha/beta fold hydrolase n=1 Tax=Rhizobium sp. 18055 TaxID=2681403 RepID=UPI0013582CE8|nr:alpha/beta hydrolase [Rhizobium sp. 18055]